jgi:splicing factor 3B subunit 3
VQDTSILSSAPTLAVQQTGADALLQVHLHGICHILADHRINQWSVPQGRTIVTTMTDKHQVVFSLSSAELFASNLILMAS